MTVDPKDDPLKQIEEEARAYADKGPPDFVPPQPPRRRPTARRWINVILLVIVIVLALYLFFRR